MTSLIDAIQTEIEVVSGSDSSLPTVYAELLADLEKVEEDLVERNNNPCLISAASDLVEKLKNSESIFINQTTKLAYLLDPRTQFCLSYADDVEVLLKLDMCKFVDPRNKNKKEATDPVSSFYEG